MFEVAKVLEPVVGVGFCGFVEGMVVDAGSGTGDLAVIGCAVEVDDRETSEEEVDAGDEGVTLDAVFVEFGRVTVTCCHDDGTVVHKTLDKTTENHSVCNVSTLEFVKAEDLGFGCDFGGNERDGVDIVAMEKLDLVKFAMTILHEVVKVNAFLFLDVGREGVVEEIHHHCLSAADVSIHVHSFR